MKHRKENCSLPPPVLEEPSLTAFLGSLIQSRWETAVLLGIVLFVAVIRINLVQIPYERDEGAYIYFGQMILDGETPYRDFYEDKPPGNMYMYALLGALFGPNEGSQHAAFMLLNIATLLLVYATVRHLLGGVPALCSGLAFAMLSLSRTLAGFTCMSEHIVIFFAMAGTALLLAWEESPPPWACLLSGATMGLSCWVKQSGVFFILWGAFAAFLTVGDLRRRLLRVGWYCVGVAAVSVLFLLLMMQMGIFHDFWFSAVELPRIFVTRSMSYAEIKKQFLTAAGKILQQNMLASILATLGFPLLPFAELSLNRKIVLTLFALCSVATLIPGFTFYNHYWLQAAPAAAITAAVSISVLSRFMSRVMRGPEWHGALLGAIFFAAGAMWNSFQKRDYYFGDDYTPALRMTYGFNPFPSTRMIGEYLRNRTQSGEKIAIFGSEPQIFLYSRCRNATRHAFISHLFDPRNPFAAAWRKEYIADVEKSAPRFIVLVMNPWSLGWDGTVGHDMFQWIELYLARFYDRVGVADDSIPGEMHPRLIWDENAKNYVPKGAWWVGIYRRKPSAPPSPGT